MQNSREPKARAAAQAFVEQNARTTWGLARHRARPPTVQQAGFLQHSRPCQTFGLAVAPIFWLFKATRFNLFACQVVRDPRERAGAAAAKRQVDLLAADRTLQHRVDVKYVEVLEAGCFRKALPLPIHAAYADRFFSKTAYFHALPLCRKAPSPPPWSTSFRPTSTRSPGASTEARHHAAA